MEVINPPGFCYVDTLRRIVAAAYHQWRSILRDDDFFIQEAGRTVRPILSRKGVHFVFSDQFVADKPDDLLVEQSEKFSELYGRASLAEGPVIDITDAFVGQKICLDGFLSGLRWLRQLPYLQNTGYTPPTFAWLTCWRALICVGS